MQLSDIDAYALARVLAGLPVPQLNGISAPIQMLIATLSARKPEVADVEQLRAWFGQSFVAQIFALDPKADPPNVSDAELIPVLPKRARIDAKKYAPVGKWLDDWMRWAQSRAGMTDPMFLESGGLWLISLATARRARLSLDFADIYNPIYVLWCAPTTYHRKSTGLRAVQTMVARTFPELLLPGQSTPEMLLHRLAGGMPPNLDQLSMHFQALERAGQRFAGQRGLISDEVSKLFDKDYMKGLVEFLLELYETPDTLDKEFRSYGRIIVKNAGVSMLSATTPARLGRLFGDMEWEDGLLARFALLTPTRTHVERIPTQRASAENVSAMPVQASLRALFEKLPTPPEIDIEDGSFGDMDSIPMAIEDAALDLFNAYGDALHQMCAPGSGLDERLTGVYGRTPVMALKVAMSLGLIDWATGAQSEPAITAAHWARAQGIVEEWRFSAHRLLGDLTRSTDQRTEDRLMEVIKATKKPLTRHEWYRLAKISNRRDAYSAIDALFEAGKVSKLAMPAGMGEGYMLRSE